MKAWMTDDLFRELFTRLYSKMQAKNWKTISFIDNFSLHPVVMATKCNADFSSGKRDQSSSTFEAGIIRNVVLHFRSLPVRHLQA